MSRPEALRERLRRAKTDEIRGWTRPSSGPAATVDTSTPARNQARSASLDLKGALQARLLDEIANRGLMSASDEEIQAAVEEFIGPILEEEELAFNEIERADLVHELVEETLGVGPLAPLMADPAVTDILVNGPEAVYTERFGRLEATRVCFRDQAHVLRVIERIAARVGRRIDAASPMADLRLPDGSRVNATIPPATPDGPTLSIRRFGRRRLRASELQNNGAFSEAMGLFLSEAVRYRQNVLISGGTGAGKSTLLGAMAEFIPASERIVTIEDTLELILDQQNLVRLEARPANVEGRGRIAPRDLVINSLRMRPDRVIVGEVRGGEALDMLQAMNTGHDGSLSTVHANAPRDALSRVETMVLMAGVDLPSRAVREQIVSALDLIVHVERMEDGVRRVSRITELAGMETETPLLQEIFRFERRGVTQSRVEGDFVATGIVPRCAETLRQRGATMAPEWFQSRPGSSR
ncbi:MAG: CpaF family protein [Myxococcota bacterium]|nr:CpaF family protein [Myxococcota bacterium]